MTANVGGVALIGTLLHEACSAGDFRVFSSSGTLVEVDGVIPDRYSVHTMAAATLARVQEDAKKTVRNLPSAHWTWQRFWRDASFRRAVAEFDLMLYSASVDHFTDRDLHLVEEAARVVLNVLEIHVSGLGNGVRDEVDRQFFAVKRDRLLEAIRGLEQGLAPDPAKRPSDDEFMDRLAAGLTRAKLA